MLYNKKILIFIKNKNEAFTIVELMIVVAIIGILAAISYTMYASYFQTAFQAEVISKMKDIQLKQTSRFAINGTYACDIEDFPAFDDGGTSHKYVLNDDKIGKRKFTMSIENCTSSGSNAQYTVLTENDPNDNKWKVEWKLECGISSTSPCEPELTKGKSILKNLF